VRKALIVFGTRPEVIKLAPIVNAAKSCESIEVTTCATAQHRELLDQVLSYFNLVPDFDLNLMQVGQTLFDLTGRCLSAVRGVIELSRPNLVIVQGDTATAFSAALAAYYSGVKVAHVEAGLRTGDIRSPFPEEFFRKAIGCIADFHFAPTPQAARNLEKENIAPDRIHMTGNTVVDALKYVASLDEAYPHLACLFEGRTPILFTTHRRENFGEPLLSILRAVRAFADQNPDVQILYPVHPNPNVRLHAYAWLESASNVSLLEPLDYGEMVYLLRKSQFVVTDSGGLQEEAPTFGKPVLILRDSTERPEAVEAGCARLVGHDFERILAAMSELNNVNSVSFQSMSRVANPFGDGKSAERILDILTASKQPTAKRADAAEACFGYGLARTEPRTLREAPV